MDPTSDLDQLRAAMALMQEEIAALNTALDNAAKQGKAKLYFILTLHPRLIELLQKFRILRNYGTVSAKVPVQHYLRECVTQSGVVSQNSEFL